MAQLTKQEMEKRRNLVSRLLIDNGCKSTLSGFYVLQEVIIISVEEPGLSCESLFRKYALGDDERGVHPNDEKKWKASYRAARYCLINSLSRKVAVYTFIRDSAILIKDAEFKGYDNKGALKLGSGVSFRQDHA